MSNWRPKLAARFHHESPAGKLIRLPLSLIPDNRIVKIMSGVNRGMLWVTGTGPSRACWLGHYEADHLAVLPELVKPGMIAYDLGANAGYYTLALSRLAQHVYAFEPEAANVHALRRHVQLNRLENVTIVQAAVSRSSGIVSFSGSSATGKIGGSGYLVPSISLDEFMASRPAPDFLKMDIEGAELDALEGMQAKPIICLAVHSPELHKGCTDLLDARGYRITGFDSGDLLAIP